MPNFGGIAYSKNSKGGMKANPKATTSAGGSPFSITGPGHPAADKAPVHTGGSFNPAEPTDNFTAASTKNGNIEGNPKPTVAGGRASPY